MMDQAVNSRGVEMHVESRTAGRGSHSDEIEG